MRYLTIPLRVDASVLVQNTQNFIKSLFPGWRANDGNLDTWMIEAVSAPAADLYFLASAVPDTIFRYFGATMMDIPPDDAASSITTTTWTAIDDNGYQIPAGTQVGLTNELGDTIPFLTLNDVLIPPGSTQTDVGEVTIVSLMPGDFTAGLGEVGGEVILIDPLDWVSVITQTGITVGGQDAETDDDYLSRLRAELSLLTPRPILPDDFSVLARRHASVWRAVTIDGYNPVDQTFNNERMVAVAMQDETGEPVSTTVKAEVQVMLDNLREVNFVVNTIDPLYRVIDVTYTAKPAIGFDPVAVKASLDATIRNFLDPVKWGVPQDGDPHVWENQNTIRYLELAAAMTDTHGVDYIRELFIGVQTTPLEEHDVVITGGVAMLPRPGNINGVIF